MSKSYTADLELGELKVAINFHPHTHKITRHLDTEREQGKYLPIMQAVSVKRVISQPQEKIKPRDKIFHIG